MLKVKDNVDLKELEKFGFEYNNWEMRYERKVERVYEETILVVHGRKVLLECISDYGIDGDEYYIEKVESYIQDLVEADLIEKVDDK